jgi:hypothetical protein
MRKIIGTAVLVLSLSSTAFAGGETCKPFSIFGIRLWEVCLPVTKATPRTAVAPEFNGASAAAALTLFAGGLAIYLGRRRSKTST